MLGNIGIIRYLAHMAKSFTMTRMSKNSSSVWSSGLVINLTSNFIAFIVGGIVSYFSHEGSTWVKPLLFGALAWLVTFVSILAIRFMRRIPPRGEPVTPENIGRKIRDWLDEFNLTVKSVNDPDAHFFYIVTTEGGKKITIFRGKKKFSDYIEFGSHLNETDEEKQQLADWSEDEKTATRLAMILELTRAVMAYRFDDDFEKLHIFRRIPITSTLTAEEIFREIWAVEAMVGSIYAVAQMGIHRHKVNNQSNSAITSVLKSGSAKVPHSS
jgi:hypothetical protein